MQKLWATLVGLSEIEGGTTEGTLGRLYEAPVSDKGELKRAPLGNNGRGKG